LNKIKILLQQYLCSAESFGFSYPTVSFSISFEHKCGAQRITSYQPKHIKGIIMAKAKKAKKTKARKVVKKAPRRKVAKKKSKK
jgi:hypothetical protein